MAHPTGLLPHDPAREAAAPVIFQHARDVTGPPDTLDRDNFALHPSIGANYWASDCTGESLRELMQAICLLSGYDLAVTPDASLQFFCECVGLPVTATHDQIVPIPGTDMMTAAARAFGPGFNTGNERIIGLWGRTPNLEIETLANGAAKFGMLWVGGTIYQRDVDELYQYGAWDDDGVAPRGDVVGLHAFCGGWGYQGLDRTSRQGVDTWGVKKLATWRWLQQRAQIVLCVRCPQLDPAGSAAVDEAALTAALETWANA